MNRWQNNFDTANRCCRDFDTANRSQTYFDTPKCDTASPFFFNFDMANNYSGHSDAANHCSPTVDTANPSWKLLIQCFVVEQKSMVLYPPLDCLQFPNT